MIPSKFDTHMVSTLADARAEPSAKGTPEEVAQQFEGYFFHQMLKAMRQTVARSDLFGSGLQSDYTQSLLDAELAKAAAKTGTLGLGEMLVAHGLNDAGQTRVLEDVEVEGFQGHVRPEQRFGAHRDGARSTECGDGHCGVDLAMPVGTPIHVEQPGTIVHIHDEDNGNGGRWLAVRHADGEVSRYFHLSRVATDLSVGADVVSGQEIGRVGDSGLGATGPHLHFELTENNVSGRRRWLNPERVLNKYVGFGAQESGSAVDISDQVQREREAP